MAIVDTRLPRWQIVPGAPYLVPLAANPSIITNESPAEKKLW